MIISDNKAFLISRHFWILGIFLI